MKQEVFRKSKEFFTQLKEVVAEVSTNLDSEICKLDDAVKVSYKDKSPFECELQFSGDTLLFNMHTNVFTFDAGHRIWKTGYIKEDKKRAYFGMFNIYNFLSDSLKYDRLRDVGVLLGRIFVNREGHFFVEGKKQLGFLYGNIVNQILDHENLRKIVDTAMIHTLEYDLTVPDYADVMLVSVQQMIEMSNQLHLKTAKKVQFGYYGRMQHE